MQNFKKFGLNDNVEAVERKMTTTVSFIQNIPLNLIVNTLIQKDNLFTTFTGIFRRRQIKRLWYKIL